VAANYEAQRSADDRYPDYPQRITYIIDPGGTIAAAYKVTDVASHPDDVLGDLQALIASS
jgi:peroxiredoxin